MGVRSYWALHPHPNPSPPRAGGSHPWEPFATAQIVVLFPQAIIRQRENDQYMLIPVALMA